jgi:CRP-like cAMP-binding protein
MAKTPAVHLPEIDTSYASQWRTSLSDPGTQQKFLKMLGRVPIFAQLSESFRSSMFLSLQPVDYQVGDVVYRQGDRSDWIGIVLRGKLEYYVQPREDADSAPSGERAAKSRKVKDVMPGGTVGDINVLGILEERNATVNAIAPSTLLVLSRANFCAAVSTSKDQAFVDSTKRLHSRCIEDRTFFYDSACFRKFAFAPDFVSALYNQVEHRVFYAGHVMMREGGFGNEMYILLSGHWRREKSNKQANTLSDGASVGELAILGSDKRRRATVTCLSLCLVAVIHEDVVSKLLEEFPHCKSAFHHAYIKTLVGDGLSNAHDEIKQLDNFYGRAHPLTAEEMIRHGFGGDAFAQMHKNRSRPKSGTLAISRPSTARRWVPEKIPSRPSTVQGMHRAESPCRWERQCHSSCD